MTNHSKTPLAALALFAAGAGLGFFAGKKFSEPGGRAEMLARWQELKDTILSKMRTARGLTEAKYGTIVDRSVDEYVQSKQLGTDEAERLKQRFREKWKKMLVLVERSAREAREEMEDESKE